MTPETATLISAGIAAVSAVGVAVVGVAGNRSHKATREKLAENTTKTDAVLHQVRNDHPTNLRDDLDQLAELVAKHSLGQADLEAGLSRVASMVGTVNKTLKGIRDHVESHDAASLLIVRELHDADRALAAEIARHHPQT